MKTNRREKGQIVVILALSMVALISITALAIDGSLIYSERRQDQNTADSAALAGAGAAANYLKDVNSGTLICGRPEGTAVTSIIVNAVQTAVSADGITAAEMPKLANETELAAVDQGFTVACKWYETLGTQYLDIHVKLSSETNTNFGRMVSRDTLKTSVDSISRVYPTQPFAYGNGLVSLSTQCQEKVGGIEFLGSSEVHITSGGVFSNSCIEANTGIVDVIGGSIQYWYQSACDFCFNNPDVSPTPVPAYTRLPSNMIPAPTCPERTASNTHSAFKGLYSGTIYPGWYLTGLNSENNKTLILSPGLYCIEGGMTNNSKSTIIANHVTLYFFSGAVTINQNSVGSIELTSCPEEPCGDPSAVQGLLMYFSPDYLADVQMMGDSDNFYRGTIFGSNANVQLSGNTDISVDDAEAFNFSTQVVARWIGIRGNTNLVMNLNDDDFVSMPASLSLIK